MLNNPTIQAAYMGMVATYNATIGNFLLANPSNISSTTTFQGHRGARGLLPENTIPSFLKSFELGVNMVELDVVISGDKEVVISHEEWFSSHISTKPDGSPVTKAEELKHLLYQMPYEEIKRYDCGKRGHVKFPKQQAMPAYKPLLKELILAGDAYSKEQQLKPVFYNIEIKTSGPKGDIYLHPEPPVFAKLVLGVIQEMGIEDRCLVQSFDVRIVQEMKRIAPKLQLSLLLDNIYSMKWNLTQLGFTPDVYAPYYRLITPRMVKQAHNYGMKIITWTVNDLPSMRRLQSYGVDSIITDYPDLVAEL